MGLNSTINFISWLISSFIPMIIVSIVVAGKISSHSIIENQSYLFSRAEIWRDFSCLRSHCHHHAVIDTGCISIDARVRAYRIEIALNKLDFRLDIWSVPSLAKRILRRYVAF